MFLHANSEDSDQTGRIVGFVVLWFLCGSLDRQVAGVVDIQMERAHTKTVQDQ